MELVQPSFAAPSNICSGTHHSPALSQGGYQDDPWFMALHERLRDEHDPRTTLEAHLVWRLAMAMWRSERAARMEDALLSGTWTVPHLRALLTYQTVQQRETREVLKLLKGSRKVTQALGKASDRGPALVTATADDLADAETSTIAP